jgi:cbb3-type cytochrome oxidase cytochrome c subunit
LRKVGPNLGHIGQKTSQGWLESWLENPAHFRPMTRMPRFFGLTNQQDADAKKFNPVEIAAIATYLRAKSSEMDLDSPKEGYVPDATRGAGEFAKRGCLACHFHDGIEGATRETGKNFGPDLSRVHAKLKAGKKGFQWLYTWVRNPQRYHPRTKMPHMFLEPETVKGEYHDPAADIAAFLLSRQTDQGETAGIEQHTADDFLITNFDKKGHEEALDELVVLYLTKVLKKDEVVGNPRLLVEGYPVPEPKKVEGFMQTRRFPLDPKTVKGDEVELLSNQSWWPDDAEWLQTKLRYVGRRTISRYGCFGCHEIPGFEDAKPIGTALQDWGRKDTTKLAFEHIVEYLKHHGEAGGGSTRERAEEAVDRRLAGESPEDAPGLERDLHAAARYESILHHGRDGFLFQKLRAPRSYDYQKTSTKGYDERLRMPKFPFDEKQIEAVSTFVLGLVAEPPPDKYVYRPEGTAKDLIDGERVLQKYNCRGCHMTDLPEVSFAMQEGDFLYHEGLADDEFQRGYDLLMQIKPPRQGLTDEKVTVEYFGETGTHPVVNFRGLLAVPPDPLDPPEDRETGFDVWETLLVGEKVVTPATRVTVVGPYLLDQKPGNGGRFAEWLVEHLMNDPNSLAAGKRGMGWQMSPPVLYKEGAKVQTPWLYKFLLNPYRIRHLPVLRMPRFNMDPEEAQILADYFAAVDGVPYPYLDVPQREARYLERKDQEFEAEFHKSHDYLSESWRVLNANICIGCHSVGGREVKVDPMDPTKSIRGPDLNQTRDRLRPDWMALWIFKPPWITPGTAMPVNFARNKNVFEDVPPGSGNGLFGGDGEKQVIGVRDALMNYYRLIERDGPIVYEPPKQPGAQPANNAGND